MAHLAQVNVAKGRGFITSPVMASFVAATGAVNRIADAAPGFVWRMKGEDENELAMQVFGDPLLVINMSVWESVEALRAYTYTTEHVEIMRRRREWFTRSEGPHLAMWWIAEGTTPTPQEGRDRLNLLRTHGSTEHAFTFSQVFGPPASLDLPPTHG